MNIQTCCPRTQRIRGGPPHRRRRRGQVNSPRSTTRASRGHEPGQHQAFQSEAQPDNAADRRRLRRRGRRGRVRAGDRRAGVRRRAGRHGRHAPAASTVVTYALPTATDNEDPSPDVGLHAGVRQHVPRRPDAASPARPPTPTATSATKTFTVTVRGLLNVGGDRAGDAVADARRTRLVRRVHPGRRRRTYTASTTANVISTAGDAALTVTDPSATHTGRLVNGTFALPQPLQGLGTIKTYAAPISNDVVTVQFTPAGRKPPMPSVRACTPRR